MAMSLYEKIIAEARIERETTGIKIVHDRDGNRCLSYPHSHPKYRAVHMPDRVIYAHVGTNTE